MTRPAFHLFFGIYAALATPRLFGYWLPAVIGSLSMLSSHGFERLCLSWFLWVRPLLSFSSCRALMQSLRAVRAVRSYMGAVHSLPFTYGRGSSIALASMFTYLPITWITGRLLFARGSACLVRAIACSPFRSSDKLQKVRLFEPVQSFTRARATVVYSAIGSTIVTSSDFLPVFQSMKLQTAVFTTL